MEALKVIWSDEGDKHTNSLAWLHLCVYANITFMSCFEP